MPADSRPLTNEEAIANPGRPGRQRSHILRPNRHEHRPPRVWTTWSLAYLPALALAAFVGVEAASNWRVGANAYVAAAVAAIALVGVAAFLVVLRLPASLHWLVAAAAFFALPTINTLTPVDHPWLLGLPAAVVAALYGFFLNVSYHELTHPQEGWGVFALASAAFVERMLLGDGELEMKWRAMKIGTARTPAGDD